MSLSPSDILHRLKQLKLWQESQEQLLRKAKNLVDTSANVSHGSDYQTIEGLSAFDTSNDDHISREPVDIDSKVISPTKSFHELLEEKLAEDEGPKAGSSVAKRPFLKKGAGLERFKMRPKTFRKKARSKSESFVTPLRAPDLAVQRASWSNVEESQAHIRKINEQLQQNNGSSEQSLYEKALEKELLIFEALEQKAENSSFCSTNSSVVRILSSTPSKIRPIVEEKRVHWESQSEDEDFIETNLEKRDIADILLRLKNITQKSTSTTPSTTDVSEDERSSSVTSTDFEMTLRTEKHDVGIGTDATNEEICIICEDKFIKKMTEYDKKLKEFEREKNQMDVRKRQFEQKEREFLKKRKEFDEERQDHIFELETEKKRLAKEKQSFQTYMKESQNRPSRKERQEISNLKQELADLSETLKLKESKNGMTQARLRNQIKHLEKENLNLKNEVERLTKENAKLSATQKFKRKSADAKILQEISKNVTKLTQQSAKTNKEPTVLDVEDSLLILGTSKANKDLEVQYENIFRNQTVANASKTSDKTERLLEDGSKECRYSNGNVKTISPNGNFITVQYFNGDKQETNLLDGTVKYYFANRNICQTTFADGMEVVEFPEGVIEKRYKDGKCEITLPDGVVQTTYPDGNQETKYTDGSIVKLFKNGEKVLLLPNGQKEVETKEYKKREYPDGTVKILYPDGTQETKYSNGRVRIKDGSGALILDTQS